MLTSTLGQYFSAMELKAREDKNNIDFQVDVISESLRELQQEKKRLQNFLENERAKRKDTESKLNLVNARLSNVQERHSKISAARDIAKKKMKESEDLVNRLQSLNFSKQKKIGDINEQMDEENKLKEEKCLEFSHQLDELAKQFFNAQKDFDEESLINQEEELQRKMTKITQAAKESKIHMEELTQQFSKFVIVQEEKTPSANGWPSIQEAENVLDMIKKENDLICGQHDSCHMEIMALKLRVNQMMEKLAKPE